MSWLQSLFGSRMKVDQEQRTPLADTPHESGHKLGEVLLKKGYQPVVESLDEERYQALGRKHVGDWYQEPDDQAEFLEGWNARWGQRGTNE